jgi:hypothetical protein
VVRFKDIGAIVASARCDNKQWIEEEFSAASVEIALWRSKSQDVELRFNIVVAGKLLPHVSQPRIQLAAAGIQCHVR